MGGAICSALEIIGGVLQASPVDLLLVFKRKFFFLLLVIEGAE
jgi:hypothetical protein